MIARIMVFVIMELVDVSKDSKEKYAMKFNA
jgi:hypothetical protein